VQARRALAGKVPAELVALDIREGIYSLGLITGESADINILERIFERFCIGK